MKHAENKTRKSFLKILINKYTIVVVVFLAYLTFFDDHNLIKKWQLKQSNIQLEKELIYYQDEIKHNKEMIRKLKTDSVFLEKYAREKYFLKRDQEEVFIIPDTILNENED